MMRTECSELGLLTNRAVAVSLLSQESTMTRQNIEVPPKSVTRQTTLSLIKVQRYMYVWSEGSGLPCRILSIQALHTKFFDKHPTTEGKMATWITILNPSKLQGRGGGRQGFISWFFACHKKQVRVGKFMISRSLNVPGHKMGNTSLIPGNPPLSETTDSLSGAWRL